MKESDILATIMDGLAAKRIWRKRMNSGAMKGSHKGKGWFVRFGEPGMADILATITNPVFGETKILWIEVKNEKGRQSDEQTTFMHEVRSEGHYYLVARSWEDVCGYIAREIGV